MVKSPVQQPATNLILLWRSGVEQKWKAGSVSCCWGLLTCQDSVFLLTHQPLHRFLLSIKTKTLLTAVSLPHVAELTKCILYSHRFMLEYFFLRQQWNQLSRLLLFCAPDVSIWFSENALLTSDLPLWQAEMKKRSDQTSMQGGHLHPKQANTLLRRYPNLRTEI